MSPTSPVVASQLAYYRASANEYEDHAIEVPGKDDLLAAVDAFRPAGDVLELACGSGRWTERLLRTASSVTAVDGAPEMLARAKARLGSGPVRFIEANLFSWRPDRQYSAIFFGFWLSHVPEERFDAFWSLVDECLEPGGQVFFCDDNYRLADEMIDGPDSPTVERRLNDGTAFQVLKIPHQADELERRLRALNWDISVHPTPGPFYWGTGGRPTFH